MDISKYRTKFPPKEHEEAVRMLLEGLNKEEIESNISTMQRQKSINNSSSSSSSSRKPTGAANNRINASVERKSTKSTPEEEQQRTRVTVPMKKQQQQPVINVGSTSSSSVDSADPMASYSDNETDESNPTRRGLESHTNNTHHPRQSISLVHDNSECISSEEMTSSDSIQVSPRIPMKHARQLEPQNIKLNNKRKTNTLKSFNNEPQMFSKATSTASETISVNGDYNSSIITNEDTEDALNGNYEAIPNRTIAVQCDLKQSSVKLGHLSSTSSSTSASNKADDGGFKNDLMSQHDSEDFSSMQVSSISSTRFGFYKLTPEAMASRRRLARSISSRNIARSPTGRASCGSSDNEMNETTMTNHRVHQKQECSRATSARSPIKSRSSRKMATSELKLCNADENDNDEAFLPARDPNEGYDSELEIARRRALTRKLVPQVAATTASFRQKTRIDDDDDDDDDDEQENSSLILIHSRDKEHRGTANNSLPRRPRTALSFVSEDRLRDSSSPLSSVHDTRGSSMMSIANQNHHQLARKSTSLNRRLSSRDRAYSQQILTRQQTENLLAERPENLIRKHHHHHHPQQQQRQDYDEDSVSDRFRLAQNEEVLVPTRRRVAVGTSSSIATFNHQRQQQQQQQHNLSTASTSDQEMAHNNSPTTAERILLRRSATLRANNVKQMSNDDASYRGSSISSKRPLTRLEPIRSATNPSGEQNRRHLLQQQQQKQQRVLIEQQTGGSCNRYRESNLTCKRPSTATTKSTLVEAAAAAQPAVANDRTKINTKTVTNNNNTNNNNNYYNNDSGNNNAPHLAATRLLARHDRSVSQQVLNTSNNNNNENVDSSSKDCGAECENGLRNHRLQRATMSRFNAAGFKSDTATRQHLARSTSVRCQPREQQQQQQQQQPVTLHFRRITNTPITASGANQRLIETPTGFLVETCAGEKLQQQQLQQQSKHASHRERLTTMTTTTTTTESEDSESPKTRTWANPGLTSARQKSRTIKDGSATSSSDNYDPGRQTELAATAVNHLSYLSSAGEDSGEMSSMGQEENGGPTSRQQQQQQRHNFAAYTTNGDQLDFDSQQKLNEIGLPNPDQASGFMASASAAAEAESCSIISGASRSSRNKRLAGSPSYRTSTMMMMTGDNHHQDDYANSERSMPNRPSITGRAMSQQSLIRPTMPLSRRLRRSGGASATIGGHNSTIGSTNKNSATVSDIGESSMSLNSRGSRCSNARYESAHTRTPVVMYIPQASASAANSRHNSVSDLLTAASRVGGGGGGGSQLARSATMVRRAAHSSSGGSRAMRASSKSRSSLGGSATALMMAPSSLLSATLQRTSRKQSNSNSNSNSNANSHQQSCDSDTSSSMMMRTLIKPRSSRTVAKTPMSTTTKTRKRSTSRSSRPSRIAAAAATSRNGSRRQSDEDDEQDNYGEDHDGFADLATDINSYKFTRRYSVPKDAKINWFSKLKQRVTASNKN